MIDYSRTLVVSLRGNDKGRVFVALKNVGEQYVLYADGRKRGAFNPKLKKVKHIHVLGESGIGAETPITNKVLRKATAPYAGKKYGLTGFEEPAMKEG